MVVRRYRLYHSIDDTRYIIDHDLDDAGYVMRICLSYKWYHTSRVVSVRHFFPADGTPQALTAVGKELLLL